MAAWLEFASISSTGRSRVASASRPGRAAGVESASARYRSVWGDIVSAWHRRAGRVYLEVEIPAGALARIETPAFQVQVGSGRYSIETRDGHARNG